MRPVFATLLLTALVSVAHAKPAVSPELEGQALDLTKQLIALRTVRGEGNKTGEAMQLIKEVLVGAGWRDSEVEIQPVDDTALMYAIWSGSDPKLKPLVISGHIDVVAADPADWKRDPFTPVVENGYLFGRGASDMKTSAVLAVTALVDLRKSGYRPKRSIVIAFSGDEETTMKTARVLAERVAGAEMVLNADGGGGALSEDGKALFYAWDGAEKTYIDYRLEVTNPGGHSSAPRAENAIVQLAAALQRIGAYRFKPEQNPLTRAYFEQAAQFESDPKLAAAMRAFSANKDDAEAVATLRASPSYVGKTGTTCVPTMVSGGHAENALPQRATAIINCRIFPGHSRAEIMAELQHVANSPQVSFSDATGSDSTESPASPVRADLVAAMARAIEASWPGVPIIPTQASGASDNMWFRAKEVPSYGISPIFIKDSDDFSHGLNERVELRIIAPGLAYYRSLFTDLSN